MAQSAMMMATNLQHTGSRNMYYRLGLALLTTITLATFSWAHQGPDPLSHWYLQSKHIKDGQLESRLGPNGQLLMKPRYVADSGGDALIFEGRNAGCILALSLIHI